jgi:hypothetical protein
MDIYGTTISNTMKKNVSAKEESMGRELGQKLNGEKCLIES